MYSSVSELFVRVIVCPEITGGKLTFILTTSKAFSGNSKSFSSSAQRCTEIAVWDSPKMPIETMRPNQPLGCSASLADMQSGSRFITEPNPNS